MLESLIYTNTEASFLCYAFTKICCRVDYDLQDNTKFELK